MVLYRQGATIYPMEFMAEERQKMEEKEHKKKGNKEEVKSGIDFIFLSGGPPVLMHYASINLRVDDYLDSTDFKNYNYNFVASSSDADKDILQIDFVSKGVVEHVRLQGRIFIHLPTNAILKIEGKGNFVIPVLLRPLMFLYGFSAEDLSFEGKKEYQMVNGKWYFKAANLSAISRSRSTSIAPAVPAACTMALLSDTLPSSADAAFTTPLRPTIAVSIIAPAANSTTREIAPE